MQAPSYTSFLTRRRYTKPCRFFQQGGCKKSAGECPFAHVPAEERVQRPRACKYYVAGHCDMGHRCRFLHGDDTSRFYTPPPPAPPPPPSHTASPVSCTRPMSGYHSDTSAFSDNYPPSEPSIATSDDLFIEIASHADSDSDRIFPTTISNGYEVTLRTNTLREKRRLANERRRASKFKTKPCKFYNTPEGCPSGTHCTFIHVNPPTPQVVEVTTPTGCADKSLKHPHGPWRVISGGVIFGAKLPARKHKITRAPTPTNNNTNTVEETESVPTPLLTPQPIRPGAPMLRTLTIPDRPISAPPSTARLLPKGRSMFAAEA